MSRRDTEVCGATYADTDCFCGIPPHADGSHECVAVGCGRQWTDPARPSDYAENLQRSVTEMVALQIRKVSGIVDDIRAWCDTSEAKLYETTPCCSGCVGARDDRLKQISEIRALLPAVPRTSGDAAGEVPDERNASDPGRRPGLVTPP